LLIGPNKTFACAACEVEPIPSANKVSLVCSKKVHGNDVKMAHVAKGCFVTMKIKIADCIAENQDDIAAYNSSKSKPSTVKSTETLARELVARKRLAIDNSADK
jgi:hypothetical protein